MLRFYGVPILAAPVLSFPLSDARKSGWLPPSFGLDSKSGFQVAVPYYWNIAPNRDATFTPSVSARRGAGARAPSSATSSRATAARSTLNLLPDDRVAERSRYCAARRARRQASATTPLLQLQRAARLRRRLLEGLPARRRQPDAAPAGDRPAASAGRFGDWTDLRARCSAGRCCRRSTRRRASRRRTSAHRRSARATCGASARRLRGRRSRPSSTASRNPTTTLRWPRADRLRVHALGSISRPFVDAGLDADAEARRSTPRRTRSTGRADGAAQRRRRA